jgi:spoIIIJ-associated protein
MNTLEITAATIEQAVAEAATKLGVKSADIDVTVLEETKGLFGKGKVRIKATVKQTASVTAAVEPIAKAPAKPAEKAPEPERPAEEKPAAEEKRPARARAAKPDKPKEEKPAAAPAEEATEETVNVVATQGDADELVGMLTELLELADLDVSVKVMELNGRYVNVTLDGRDVSFLVGRRGEVINALQYLMNVMSTRKLHNGVRVVLEGNDYRKKRQDVLTKLATQIAEEVAKRGEEAVLDALPAFERRVVHKALSEFPGIVTYSEGEEPNRRVVIAPES